MRISFDLDGTLICYDHSIPREPPLPLPLRLFIHDGPLRKGARHLFSQLRSQGHQLWIYTTSPRPARRTRLWLRLHGLPTDGYINAPLHARHFGPNSLPTKRPHAFGIHLHIDNSPGLLAESQTHGFNVCLISPTTTDWTTNVLNAVYQLQ